MRLSLIAVDDSVIDGFETYLVPLSVAYVRRSTDDQLLQAVGALAEGIDQPDNDTGLKALRKAAAKGETGRSLQLSIGFGTVCLAPQYFYVKRQDYVLIEAQTDFGLHGWMLDEAIDTANLVPSSPRAERRHLFQSTPLYQFGWMRAAEVAAVQVRRQPADMRDAALEALTEGPSYATWSREGLEQLATTISMHTAQILDFLDRAKRDDWAVVGQVDNMDWAYD